jgi:predicted alpha/beta-fold hydrolase
MLLSTTHKLVLDKLLGIFKYTPGKLKAVFLVLLKVSPVFVLSALLLLVGYKYQRNKKIEVYCKDSARNKFMVDVMGPVIKSYSPTLYLPFGFMKAALVSLRKLKFLEQYMRLDLELSDGEILPLDWYPRNYANLSPDLPIVFFIPGVFGTSLDAYCLDFCRKLHEILGWRSFVLNRRGFMRQFMGKTLVSYTHFADWREILEYLHKTFPEAPVYMVGVSMGALNIQKYLIEYSADPQVIAAVTISSPFDIIKTSKTLWFDPILGPVMHNEMMGIFRQQLHHPNFIKVCQSKGISIPDSLKAKNVYEFDEVFTCKCMGLANADAVYEYFSTHKDMEKISVPLLSVNSRDDPIVDPALVPLEDIMANENIIQLMVAGGGHIEYYNGLGLEFVSLSSHL